MANPEKYSPRWRSTAAASPSSVTGSLEPVGIAGCASSDGPYFFADAGKYQFHSCEQLATASKQKHDRQRELKELIDKAEQAVGGQIVSVLAYRSDYVAVNEEVQVIDSTVRDKKCAASPPGKGVSR